MISNENSIRVFNSMKSIHDKQDREFLRRLDDSVEKGRTKYIIQTTSPDGKFKYYYQGGMDYHWTTEVLRAFRYDFMTSAIGDATVKLSLAPFEYEIIPIVG